MTTKVFSRQAVTLASAIRCECGHSLVEAVVALAILVGIGAPAASLLAVMLAGEASSHRIVALVHAEDALEECLHRRAFSDSTWTVLEAPVQLERRVTQDGDLVAIAITATRHSPNVIRERKLVELYAVAIAPDR